MSKRQRDWLAGFTPVQGSAVDYVSDDKGMALKIEHAMSSSRGLYFAALRLAIYLDRHRSLQRGCLVLIRPLMSNDRLREEWQTIRGVLQTSMASRLRLLVIGNDGCWCVPTDPLVERMAQSWEQPPRDSGKTRDDSRLAHPGLKTYEVWKVLLNRWLQRQGPIALGALAGIVGCSYPTVRKALAKPVVRQALRFNSNRSVEFIAFPHPVWNEICVVGQSSRMMFRYQDTSGENTPPQVLLRRLEKLRPASVALGGVVAARHWDPGFDLHGTPRIDVLLHAPLARVDPRVDLGFVQRIDPALDLIDSSSQASLLVVQPLFRASSLFVNNPDGSLPWADPIETALGLVDLTLVAQANHLLSVLRPEVRLA
jgi:hypothetical protein